MARLITDVLRRTTNHTHFSHATMWLSAVSGRCRKMAITLVSGPEFLEQCLGRSEAFVAKVACQRILVHDPWGKEELCSGLSTYLHKGTEVILRWLRWHGQS